MLPSAARGSLRGLLGALRGEACAWKSSLVAMCGGCSFPSAFVAQSQQPELRAVKLAFKTKNALKLIHCSFSGSAGINILLLLLFFVKHPIEVCLKYAAESPYVEKLNE